MKLLRDLTIISLLLNVYCATKKTTKSPFMRCGKLSQDTLRIVGGRVVPPDTWPWMVHIDISSSPPKNGTKKRNICGGVLLNSEWVLSAAHCFDYLNRPTIFPNTPPKSWVVTAGMKKQNSMLEMLTRWQKRGVKRFYFYPDFTDDNRTTLHDVALLQLSKPVVFNHHIRPICLPHDKSFVKARNHCYAAGWGTTEEQGTNYSVRLREVQLPVANPWVCRFLYGSAVSIHDHICAGDLKHGNKDSCKGDSGGPLACRSSDGTWTVMGIVSSGKGCGRKMFPGIYTNVFRYTGWILQFLMHHSPNETTSIQTEIFGRRALTAGLVQNT